MRRVVLIIITTFCQMLVFAQRGKVRPEWDIDGGNGLRSYCWMDWIIENSNTTKYDYERH